MGGLFRDTLQLLDAIESPPFRRTRGRLELGLLPRKDGTRGLDRLYTTATACLADGNETLGIRCLLALGELCREVECSELLGAIGGHQSILRLMQPNCDRPQTCDADVPTGNCDVRSDLDEGEEDEVQAAAEVVAAHVLGSGCAFPVRASFLSESSPLGRFPLQYNFVVTCTKKNSSMPPSKRDLWPVEIAKAEKSLDDGIENEVEKVTAPPGENVPISILVRPVTERQQSQFDVGFQMWPAAVILSRWLCRNPKVIAGRNVLEVGAGLGLCGLVAGHIAATVTLSDFNPAVLKALEENVALNAGWSFGTGSVRSESFGQRGIDYCDNVNDNGVAISLPGRVRVRHLDWDVLHVPEKYSSSHPKQRDPAQIPELLTCEGEQFEGGVFGDGGGKVPGDVDSLDHQKRFEVIIASDHICQTSDAEGTIRVLQTLLAKGGQAHFVVAHPRTRFGVDALVPLLEKSPGLEFTCEEVEDPELVEGIEEAAYLAWLHVHVWWGDGEDTPLLGVEKAGARDMEGLLVAG